MTQMKEKTCKLLVNTKKLLSNPYKQGVYFASTIEWADSHHPDQKLNFESYLHQDKYLGQ